MGLLKTLEEAALRRPNLPSQGFGTPLLQLGRQNLDSRCRQDAPNLWGRLFLRGQDFDSHSHWDAISVGEPTPAVPTRLAAIFIDYPPKEVVSPRNVPQQEVGGAPPHAGPNPLHSEVPKELRDAEFDTQQFECHNDLAERDVLQACDSPVRPGWPEEMSCKHVTHQPGLNGPALDMPHCV